MGPPAKRRQSMEEHEEDDARKTDMEDGKEEHRTPRAPKRKKKEDGGYIREPSPAAYSQLAPADGHKLNEPFARQESPQLYDSMQDGKENEDDARKTGDENVEECYEDDEKEEEDDYEDEEEDEDENEDENEDEDKDKETEEQAKVSDDQITDQITMTLMELIQWEGLTLYGTRPRNQAKVDEIFTKIHNEDGSINRCEIINLFTDSPPSIIITSESLHEFFSKDATLTQWKPIKRNYSRAQALLMDGNHRLIALRMIDNLCASPEHTEVHNLEIYVRVFVVPEGEDEAEFKASLKKSNSSTGRRAHWSSIQYRVSALLNRRNLERAHLNWTVENPSFLENIETCRSLDIFRDGTQFEDATYARLIHDSSEMEAAFKCSKFPKELLAKIVRFFSHPNLSNVHLYKEAPRIILRVFESDEEGDEDRLDEFFADIIKSDEMSSERLRAKINDILKADAPPIELSKTPNAMRKREAYSEKKKKDWIKELLTGFTYTECADEIDDESIEGRNDIEILQSCVRGAIDGTIDDLENVKTHTQFAAIFRTQSEVSAISEWAEHFVRYGGVVIAMDLGNGIDRGLIPCALVKQRELYASRGKKSPLVRCGVFANADTFNASESDIHHAPKTLKELFDNFGFVVDEFMVVNYLK